MTDTHTEALVERVAKAISVPQHHTTWDMLSEQEKDLFYMQAEYAIAAIEALPARNDERALKLVEALEVAANALDEVWADVKLGQRSGPAVSNARRKARKALADTQPTGDTR